MRWRVNSAGEVAPEELVGKGGHEGGLLVVGGATVAAFDVFVVGDGQPVFAHSGHQLAGVAGVHAVVAGGGGQQRRRVAAAGAQLVVWGETQQVFAVGRIVGVAVLGHPGG